MPAYLAGHERLPFQERVLPILFLRPLLHSHWILRHLVHSDGVFTLERGPLYVISLTAFVFAAIFTQKLYDKISETRLLRYVVFPTFLYATMWSYLIHSEANFSYPYDFLSLAFFTAGIYFIYTGCYLALAGIVLVGTFNRETTLFLIGIYILDAASIRNTQADSRMLECVSFRIVPWMRVAVLFALWSAVKISLAHHFAHNDASENYVRFGENLGRLRLRLIPALLNICGYILPVVIFMRKDLRPTRFANYLYIVPFWFVIMFFSGVIVETRIYGEFCSYTAIALILIGERHVQDEAAIYEKPHVLAEQSRP